MIRPASIMLGALSAILTTATALPARAQLLYDPIRMNAPVLTGSEPELRLHPAPATAPEQHANLLWNLRAGLNVAALGCQFSPTLATVRNYNQLLRNQREELERARLTLENYFKRHAGAKGPREFDRYTTQVYNGISPIKGKVGFCQTAAEVGRAAIGSPKGELYRLASLRLGELRSSLVPIADNMFVVRPMRFLVPELTDPCRDKRGRRKKRC